MTDLEHELLDRTEPTPHGGTPRRNAAPPPIPSGARRTATVPPPLPSGARASRASLPPPTRSTTSAPTRSSAQLPAPTPFARASGSLPAARATGSMTSLPAASGSMPAARASTTVPPPTPRAARATGTVPPPIPQRMPRASGTMPAPSASPKVDVSIDIDVDMTPSYEKVAAAEQSAIGPAASELVSSAAAFSSSPDEDDFWARGENTPAEPSRAHEPKLSFDQLPQLSVPASLFDEAGSASMFEEPPPPKPPAPIRERASERVFETAVREKPSKPFPIVKLGIAAILVSGISAFATMKVIDKRDVPSASATIDQATAPVQMAVVEPTPAPVRVEPLPEPAAAPAVAAPDQGAAAVAAPVAAPDQATPAVAAPPAGEAAPAVAAPGGEQAAPAVVAPAVVPQPAAPAAEQAAHADESVVVTDDPPERTKRSKRSRSAKKASRRTAAATLPEAAPREAKTSSRGHGLLMVSSKPPCEIAIDGVATMLTTPQRAIKLKPGKHKVTLFNTSQAITVTYTVDIQANKPTKLIRDLMPKD